MKRKMKNLALAVTVIVLLLLMLVSSPSALKNAHQRIIEIAFMNGYITALKLDCETIGQLKEDQNMLTEKVREETKKYIERVQSLNKETE